MLCLILRPPRTVQESEQGQSFSVHLLIPVPFGYVLEGTRIQEAIERAVLIVEVAPGFRAELCFQGIHRYETFTARLLLGNL